MKNFFVAIDLGSHTVRALTAEVDEETGTVEPINHCRDFTRFALTANSKTSDHSEFSPQISNTSLEQVRNVLLNYYNYFKKISAKKILCGATGILRKAQNGRAFLADIEKELGFSYFIASEKEEAFWSTAGALQILDAVRRTNNLPDLLSKRLVFFDLGGSSTEVVCIDRGSIVWWESYSIGAASLTKNYIPSAPSKPEWIKDARKYSEKIFRDLRSRFYSFSPDIIVGGGGTVATLGAIQTGMTEYVPYQVCGVELKHDWVDELLWHLASLSLEERQSIPGLEKGREDVIIGGIIITMTLMDFSLKPSIIVTDAGFLEGVMAKSVIEEIIPGEFDLIKTLRALTWKVEKVKGHGKI
ncbi:MAG: hypothetical protein WHS38_11210 [Thermodesulforhabdaceae bacterium]